MKLGIRRKEEINSPLTADKFLKKMAENPEEIMVMINHARKELKAKNDKKKEFVNLRAGDSKGSLLVTPGLNACNTFCFIPMERLSAFKLKTEEHFNFGQHRS